MTVSPISAFEVLAAERTSNVLLAADFVDQQSCIVSEVEIALEAVVVTSDFMVSHCSLGWEPSEAAFEGA